jgi:prepilin-type processing-associated H-X9-DG protein
MDGERELRSQNATNNPERGVLIYHDKKSVRENKYITIKHIPDGPSKTILVCEAPEGLHGIWLSVKNIFDQARPINTPADFSPKYVFYDLGQDMSSYHPGGAQGLFADGSVHFLQESMQDQVLAALCSRAGGEVVNDF